MMSNATEKTFNNKFSLADALLLITATAVALSFLRDSYFDTFRIGNLNGNIIPNLLRLMKVAITFVVCWSLAVLIISSRCMHQKGNSVRHPGFIACASATMGVFLNLVAILGYGFSQSMLQEAWFVSNAIDQLLAPAALSVVIGWLTLWLVGLWKLQNTWYDYVGTLLGVTWIAMYVSNQALVYFL